MQKIDNPPAIGKANIHSFSPARSQGGWGVAKTSPNPAF